MWSSSELHVAHITISEWLCHWNHCECFWNYRLRKSSYLLSGQANDSKEVVGLCMKNLLHAYNSLLKICMRNDKREIVHSWSFRTLDRTKTHSCHPYMMLCVSRRWERRLLGPFPVTLDIILTMNLWGDKDECVLISAISFGHIFRTFIRFKLNAVFLYYTCFYRIHF